MSLSLPDLGPLDLETSGQAGRPMLLPIDSIEEDAGQPRLDFDDEALHELAATIARSGVKQPVSVRPKPEECGRWILNFGARRLRAAKLAGKTEIPAFIDESVDSYDQMIENEQREPLKPLEVALFVQRRLSAGDTQADIARQLGKSKSYVTFATALIDAPDWLMELYRSGRCKGMQELYALRQLRETRPESVEVLCTESGTITRDRLAAIRSSLNDPASVPSPALRDAGLGAPSLAGANRERVGDTSADAPAQPLIPSRQSSVVVVVEYQGMAAELVVDALPPNEGDAFIRSGPGAARQCVPASNLVLKAVTARR